MSTQESVSPCTKPVIDALYQLRIEADNYSSCASEARASNNLFNYKLYNEKATALTSLTQAFFSDIELTSEAESIEIHICNSVWYYSITIHQRSFYIPYNALQDLHVTDIPKKRVESLDVIRDEECSEYTESQAVQVINDVFDSPNRYLTTPFISVDGKSAFAGWECLDDSITINDRVTQKHRQQYDFPSVRESQFSHRLEVGDEFVTKGVSCIVSDSYEIWAEPPEDGVYIKPRRAYDLVISSDEFPGVLEETLLVDWGIQVQTLDNPLSDVSENFTSLFPFGSVNPDFDVGDTMYADITGVRYVKYELNEVVATLSGVYCYLHPVEDPDIDVGIDESPSEIVLSLEELCDRFIE